MAAQREPVAPVLGDEPSAGRLVSATRPEHGADNGAPKPRSAGVNADVSLMAQLIQNLMHALSGWPI